MRNRHRTGAGRINPGHRAQRTGLRILGILLTAVGGVFTAIGVVSFIGSMATMSGPPQYFWCAFVGLPLLGVGTALLKFAYLGAIARYTAGETAPVATDTFNYVADEVRPGVHALGSSLAAGLAGARGAERCPGCGNEHDAGAKFCDQCGASLQGATCADCGHENDADARFCAGCGKTFGDAG
ncbi:MAG: zinc ribbon domain-containing protein [Planctomycetes bacterium]|nr:zinc ribbon domain-containing protein [Planctomycetota bacterium]